MKIICLPIEGHARAASRRTSPVTKPINSKQSTTVPNRRADAATAPLSARRWTRRAFHDDARHDGRQCRENAVLNAPHPAHQNHPFECGVFATPSTHKTCTGVADTTTHTHNKHTPTSPRDASVNSGHAAYDPANRNACSMFNRRMASSCKCIAARRRRRCVARYALASEKVKVSKRDRGTARE